MPFSGGGDPEMTTLLLFYFSTFMPEEKPGQHLYTLGTGQWDVPQLRVLLEKIEPEHQLI